MNPAIDNFHVIARQVDALMKVSEFGRVLTLIYRLARRIQQEEEEGHGVEDVGDLLHEEESGPGLPCRWPCLARQQCIRVSRRFLASELASDALSRELPRRFAQDPTVEGTTIIPRPCVCA